MYRFFLKRMFDLILSLIGLPFFIVLYIFIAPAIWVEDRGPVFYSAYRLGKNGTKFRMYKFRSMKVNAPDIRNFDGSTFNSDTDFRLTKVGKVLRKTSIDEIPQILNVLRGEMSLIGPRPNLPYATNQYIGIDSERFRVRPGITGYSQAYFRNSISQEEKFKKDAYYADNISFIFDVRIIFRTAVSVLKSENINLNK
ncbi:glycosyl transferase possibly involved in lipopolysaccharide synthesis [Sphaerochaeta pleomorpha str. Grapes]|uniref:Glycosyl transferase possibly involved in lipopolysaccharide synthesis n=1 Tax=Sphaerochaeta pleomorpha (strain ATCC BAA-1885 / DSM 22778 / Grapes) TaxID=158190 RepID=G8QWW3_SPHPG|nr:sugar transferase [Sphaerochaeta pleomorpha]AEV29467.1 glycosyl transferase possibly involved in lipopolysaccharide synthesis [Sphaerochaeta pleomorpha str. Grapes]